MASTAPPSQAPRPVSASSSIVAASDTASASSHVARDVRLPHHHHHHDHDQHHHHHHHRRRRQSHQSHQRHPAPPFPQTVSSDGASRPSPSGHALQQARPATASAAAPRDAAPGTPSAAATRAAVNVPEPSSVSPPASLRGPIKRKPLSTASTLSLAALSIRSSADLSSFPLPPPYVELSKPDQRFVRPPSLDSPTLYEFSPSALALSPSETPPDSLSAADDVRRASRCIPSRDGRPGAPSEPSDVLSEYDDLIADGSDTTPDAARDSTTPTNALDDSSDDAESLYATSPNSHRPPSPPMYAPKPTPPHLKLDKVDISIDERQPLAAPPSPDSTGLAASPQINKPLPRSPGQPSPVASLFGWGNQSPSVTDFSSIPSPSPLSPARKGATNEALHPTTFLSEHHPHHHKAKSNPISYCETYLSTPPPSQPVSSLQIEEMEEELKAISSELAASIRREMDLEDLVDRLQEQATNAQAPSKRTSDYFSDSGYSSAKISDYDQSRDEIEKIQRRSEQEKASIRLELSNKLQDERAKRKALDQQIKELAEKASQMDLAQMNNLDANYRMKGLEDTCEDLRRRLSDERQSKSNFEDLLSALKGELQDACNERDNLRDEVVPQLRARVEGLESEAASYATLTYESTKMQQQLQSLQQENTTLRSSQGDSSDAFGPVRPSRSNSVAAGAFRPRGPPPVSDNGVKTVQSESRDQLAERLKDVEAQRDALHSALKNLLERQEFQNRENEKRIRALESERARLLTENPKKAGFEKDIRNLRTEINVIRRRAEEALQQKWQVEKGLVGLKMDLDRAEAEIADLRSLLEEKDILIPPSMARSSSSDAGASSVPITSESLSRAYRELQDDYAESLERIKGLELAAGAAGEGGASDEKTKLAMQRLEQSLAATMSERDAAKQQAASLQGQVESLAVIETQALERERSLADELSESAQRVEQLATQVRQQLDSNAQLRERLSEAVSRGDAERKANSERISWLQERLHELEEQLVAAQTASEDRVDRHEEELSQLREAHRVQLGRINSGGGAGSAPRSPLARKVTGSVIFGRSSSVMAARSFEDEVQIKALRERVAEVEKALADAEDEIEQVVSKMNTAQIEVMNLQEEREAAVRETRRLQRVIEQEQAKSFEERFKTLTGVVV